MEDDFLNWLDWVEDGHELLVNLVDGVRDRSIPVPLLRSFATECVNRLGPHNASVPLNPSQARNVLNNVVFNPPTDAENKPIRFQYAAPRAAPTPGTVETFITWQKLWDLIPKGTTLANLIEDEVNPLALDSSDPRFQDPSEMEIVANLVTQHGAKTVGFRVSNVSKAGAPYPIWMTTSDDAGRLTALSNELLATRIRDWLGLGFMGSGVALFSFASNAALDAKDTSDLLSRPTVFDGIDHGWFKHRTTHICPFQWGRTLDFDPSMKGEPDCDGGPEAVAPGSEYGDLFKCRYIGQLMSPPMPIQPFVLKSLLQGGGNDVLDGYRAELGTALAAGAGAP